MGFSQDSTHMTKIVPTLRRKLEVLEGHTHFLGDFWGPLDFGIMCIESCDNPIHIQWTPLLVWQEFTTATYFNPMFPVWKNYNKEILWKCVHILGRKVSRTLRFDQGKKGKNLQ